MEIYTVLLEKRKFSEKSYMNIFSNFEMELKMQNFVLGVLFTKKKKKKKKSLR